MNRSEPRDIPAELKRQVDSGHACAIPNCRLPNPEIHHIIPYSRCRKHEYDNLIALCPNHHRRADSNDIDRKSLHMYKSNLRFAIETYSRFELDILFTLRRKGLHRGIPFPSYLRLLIDRILEVGYVKLESEEPAFKIGHTKLSLDTLILTRQGLEFVKSLENEDIGYGIR